MKPIAIWYHTCINLFPAHAESIIQEQMQALRYSGLLTAADQLIVGLNGNETDRARLAPLLPSKACIFINDPETWPSGEVPTMREMREWLYAYPDYNVMYFHMKGLTAPPGNINHGTSMAIRHAMQSVVINRWRECVQLLSEGYDSVGYNWSTPADQAYWAGNFWWATSSFLSTIPPLRHSDVEHGRMEAEVWIGQGPNHPRVKDLK
jgi:hypothetical protein